MDTLGAHDALMTMHTSSTRTGSTFPGSTFTGNTRPSRAVPVEYVDGSPLDPTDPRVPSARAVQVAGVAVAHVTDENADAPTPCDGWNAGRLALHIVGAIRRLAALPGGAELTAPELSDESLSPSIGTDPGDLTTAFADAARALEEAWTDPALLGRTMKLSFAELPGAATLGIFTAEFLTHAWDLSVSIGIDPEWYDPDIEMALAMCREGIPAEQRGGEIPFAPVVEVEADARAIDRLVAFNGRNPVHPVG
jgi:uncharacterized protein (TIGR03086 family)